MFTEMLANFGKGLLLCVIKAQTLFIAGIESGESGVQSADEKGDVAIAMGIKWLS